MSKTINQKNIYIILLIKNFLLENLYEINKKTKKLYIYLGNWYEERCDPKNNFHYFYLENKNT